jgi:hypothetical protein
MDGCQGHFRDANLIRSDTVLYISTSWWVIKCVSGVCTSGVDVLLTSFYSDSLIKISAVFFFLNDRSQIMNYKKKPVNSKNSKLRLMGTKLHKHKFYCSFENASDAAKFGNI